jgi:cytochrome oxidase Cu insertion factor (SCO1/SenC/PrrC family)
MTKLRRYALLAIALVLISSGALWLRTALTPDSGQESEVTFEIGGPFSLVGSDGRPVTEHGWPGRLLLIYFGYRFCPDVCPTTLQTMAAALDGLGPQGEKVQPLFVSVDPERDRPETLAAYVALFHPRLVGATGSPEQITAMAKAFRFYFRKVAGSDPGSYTIDHSAYTFLTDDRGRVLKIFGHGTAAAEMADGIREVLRRHPS